MKRNVFVGVIGLLATLILGIKIFALPNPLKKAPSFSKFNSVVVKGTQAASDGQALLADGQAGSRWGNVEGVHVASNNSGSPALNGTILTADGSGKASWQNPMLSQGLGTTDSPTFAGLTVPAGSLSTNSLSSLPLFGNGADGDQVVTTGLTGDLYCNNLTIDAGAAVDTNGYRIFVRGTLTLNGTIRNNGQGNGSDYRGGRAATVGGGGNGGLSIVNSPGLAGTSVSNSMGGNGGSGGTAAGGAGGIASAPNAADGGASVLNAIPNALTCRTLSGLLITGGAGGGSGGSPSPSGPGGLGGGGGGVVMIAARRIVGAGFIQANGGAGGAAALDFNGGAGGGGGGCIVIVTTAPLTATITATAAGGAAGAGPNPAATAGQPGKIIVVY